MIVLSNRIRQKFADLGCALEEIPGSPQQTACQDKREELHRIVAEEFGQVKNILERIAKYGPPQGEKHESLACAFCDMGGSGYASRGDGFHDDNCAVKDAQLMLREMERQ